MQYITQCPHYSPSHHNKAFARTTTFYSRLLKSSRSVLRCCALSRKHQSTSRARLIAGSSCDAGGANRDRTGDLLLAKQALSQLSYGPALTHGWWVWMDSNHRPPPYQDGALTN